MRFTVTGQRPGENTLLRKGLEYEDARAIARNLIRTGYEDVEIEEDPERKDDDG